MMFFDLLDHGFGAVDRSAFRQTHGGEEGALILFGQEALRRPAEEEHRSRQDAEDEDEADARDAHEPAPRSRR